MFRLRTKCYDSSPPNGDLITTARFDRYAADYRQQLDRGVRVSGEDAAYFAHYKARYVARLVGSACRGPVLDFGCGIGVLAMCLRAELPSCRLDGYDVSSASLAEVPDPLTSAGTFTADLAQLGRAYAAVVVSNVLHHVPPAERPGVIAGLADRLAPGGRLFIFEHNPANPVTRWVVAHCAFDEDAILVPPGESETLIRHAGLRMMRREYVVFFPRPLAWLRRVEPWLAWCPAGAQYVLVATRR